MRTLVCTPAYGGQVTTQYLLSVITEALLAPDRLQNLKRYTIGLYTLGNESLISRARNHCAMRALWNGDDYVFFIDADMSWKWRDLKKILDSKAPIIAGLAPLKTYPLSLNLVPFAEDSEKHFPGGFKYMKAVKQWAADAGQIELTVAFCGTAFMRIHTSVFKDLIEKSLAKEYEYPDNDADPSEGKTLTHYDFFKCEPINGMYHSEDWGFCHLAREAGYEIKVHSGVYVGHTGSHTFSCNNAIDLKIGQPGLEAFLKEQPQLAIPGLE